MKPGRTMHHSGRRRIHWRQANAFTITELMVAFAILGFIAAISIRESGAAYNRDMLNDASLRLRAWLLEISNKPDTTGSSCQVTITTGTVSSGGVIARVLPTTCSGTPSLRIPTGFKTLTYNVGSTQTVWSFTRRNAIDSTNDVIVKLSLNGLTALRCVKVQAISGLVRLGRNNANSDVTSTGACSNWSLI
jgi:hypothetical protein